MESKCGGTGAKGSGRGGAKDGGRSVPAEGSGRGVPTHDRENGGGDGDWQQGSQGSKYLKRKCRELERSMKVMKDAFVKENAEKSAKIRRLMRDNIWLGQTLMLVKKSSFQPGPMDRPNPCVVVPQELVPLAKKAQTTIVQFQNIIPLVCKHLELKDINNCRLVCRQWNRDVCALVENWTSPNLPSEASSTSPDGAAEVASKTRVPAPHLPRRFKFAYEFYNRGKIQHFLEEMANHTGNPFLGRYLRVLWTDRTESEHFWKSILKLVDKFGEHICNLDVQVYQDRQTEVYFYKALQETLVHLPNLKYLTVDCAFNGGSTSGMAVLRQIRSSPLPPLPNLQSLKLAFEHEVRMLCAFFPLFSKQIYRLGLLDQTLGNVNFKDEYLRGLINLEHLEVELKYEEKNDIQRLLKFPCRNLKTLCFSSTNDSRPEVSFTSKQFGSLFEKFPRLEHLDLGYYQVEVSSSSALRFSMLKTLKIEIDVDDRNRQQNLDFLLWFPSLKQLCIRDQFWRNDAVMLPIVDKLDKRSVVKLWNCLYTTSILDSNIWNLIPSLELLATDGWIEKEYTREMYEKRVRVKGGAVLTRKEI